MDCKCCNHCNKTLEEIEICGKWNGELGNGYHIYQADSCNMCEQGSSAFICITNCGASDITLAKTGPNGAVSQYTILPRQTTLLALSDICQLDFVATGATVCMCWNGIIKVATCPTTP